MFLSFILVLSFYINLFRQCHLFIDLPKMPKVKISSDIISSSMFRRCGETPENRRLWKPFTLDPTLFGYGRGSAEEHRPGRNPIEGDIFSGGPYTAYAKLDLVRWERRERVDIYANKIQLKVMSGFIGHSLETKIKLTFLTKLSNDIST